MCRVEPCQAPMLSSICGEERHDCGVWNYSTSPTSRRIACRTGLNEFDNRFAVSRNCARRPEGFALQVL